MPVDDRLGLDYEKSLPPGVVKISEKAYGESVRGRQPEFWQRAYDDLKLFSEKQDFEVELGVGFEQRKKKREGRSEHLGGCPVDWSTIQSSESGLDSLLWMRTEL